MAFKVDRSRTIISAMIHGRKVTAMDVAWLRREVFADGVGFARGGGRTLRRRARGLAKAPRMDGILRRDDHRARRLAVAPAGVVGEAAGGMADRARRRMRLGQCAGGAGRRARRGPSRAPRGSSPRCGRAPRAAGRASTRRWRRPARASSFVGGLAGHGAFTRRSRSHRTAGADVGPGTGPRPGDNVQENPDRQSRRDRRAGSSRPRAAWA